MPLSPVDTYYTAGSFCSASQDHQSTMAQTRSFATIGSSLWNALPSSLRLTLLSGCLSGSLPLLKTYFCSRAVRTGSDTTCKWSLVSNVSGVI